MYSGTTLTRFSGRIAGVHQKFDRVARKHLNLVAAERAKHFPSIREILRFEGKDGPDGIKRKSPAQNEPWHYVNPFDITDSQLYDGILDHYNNLISALKKQNTTKAAFEAAWLAHAIVDGLTPAHHFPYEEELIKLRGGEGIESRTTLKEKLIMHGDTRRERLKNNWKMWGPKGLMSTHGAFELGVAAIVVPMKLQRAKPTNHDLETVKNLGFLDVFQRRAKEVAAMDLYAQYYKSGWTPNMAKKVRRRLAPIIVNTVTLAWYSALLQSEGKKPA
jgi:hypothetical protein